jgi:hypothetical protein
MASRVDWDDPDNWTFENFIPAAENPSMTPTQVQLGHMIFDAVYNADITMDAAMGMFGLINLNVAAEWLGK